MYEEDLYCINTSNLKALVWGDVLESSSSSLSSSLSSSYLVYSAKNSHIRRHIMMYNILWDLNHQFKFFDCCHLKPFVVIKTCIHNEVIVLLVESCELWRQHIWHKNKLLVSWVKSCGVGGVCKYVMGGVGTKVFALYYTSFVIWCYFYLQYSTLRRGQFN